MKIEDYALLSDLETAALVGRNGSVDWLCLPRFDSAACFAALLGDERNGHWQIRPAAEPHSITRRYREGTLVLETDFQTSEGSVRIVDFMPPRDQTASLARVVEGLGGRVPMRMQLVIRLDYGLSIPWVTKEDGELTAVMGPDAIRLRTPIEVRGEDFTTVADFTVDEGDRVPFLLDWHASFGAEPEAVDPLTALETTESFWRAWSERCTYDGQWREAVTTSLVTLKGLTHAPTGGIVAAPTTSLPETLGGVRNWDYRFCWVRDSSLTLAALIACGYTEEALAFREWLLRATAGDPRHAQIMYGVAGERRLPEQELPWLAGYEGSRPVRVGNAAANQFQLDVFGELLDVAHLGRETAKRLGVELPGLTNPRIRNRIRVLLDHVESVWRNPDEGIWEVRGPRRPFTHSKVMAWVAFDRAVKGIEQFGIEGPLERWKQLRAEIHAEVCHEAYDTDRNTFTQYYGSPDLDAAQLLIPAVGFLPPEDERVIGTVEAIQRELTEDGFVYRYSDSAGHAAGVDGLPGKEGFFLPCSFWLADALMMIGRRDEALALFERLLGLRNDLGLLSEEYDAGAKRLVGNFPQAFTHLALVHSAKLFETAGG
jgi:GH15 family glucan-1,4-alpha-glucosidase